MSKLAYSSELAPSDTLARDAIRQMHASATIRSVIWKDLSQLSRSETARELLLSLPWFVLSLYLAWLHLYPLALIASFFFFLTGLRQAHDAHHYNLGLPRGVTDCFLFLLSILMLGSMHAVQFNHIRHHKHCLGDLDIEGRSARMSWWRAILWGPAFPILLHKVARVRGQDTTGRLGVPKTQTLC